MHPDNYTAILSNFEEKKKQERKEDEVKSRNGSITNALLKFFIKERLPLAKVDSIHLRNLIDGMSHISYSHKLYAN